MAITIEHLPERGRFQALVEGHLCMADYRLAGSVMQMTHTAVHPCVRGQGIAAELVDAALVYARANGLKVDPLCSYVRAHIRRHPQARDLLA
jgi:predicted GNAT family acetyltransferase